MSNEEQLPKGVTCKGSVALGSGCMRCEKCRDEIERGVKPLVMLTTHISSGQTTLPETLQTLLEKAKDLAAKLDEFDQISIPQLVLLKKPNWRKFSEEKPKYNKILYTYRSGLKVITSEELDDTYLDKGVLQYEMVSGQVYTGDDYYTYADELDLSSLLP